MTEKILSIFIDESGDFGQYSPQSPYYYVAMVLHEQSIDIKNDIKALEVHIKNLGFEPHAIHTGPLIRRDCKSQQKITMTYKLSKTISDALKTNYKYLSQFDSIIIYYDNGQIELTKILTSVFNTLFSNVEFRRVHPTDYKLFQVADLICTVELLATKANCNSFTNSEVEFFGSPRTFKKNIYKQLKAKKL